MLFAVLGRVFRQARYLQIAMVVTFLALSVAILLPYTAIILQVFSSTSVGLVTKFVFLGSLYGALFSNFTIFAAVTTICLALLFGINTSLLVYYIRRRQKQAPLNKSGGHTAGALGVVSGVFGIGCAACGSVIISGLLTLVGGTWLLALLPLHGAEFGLLGVTLLSYSVYQLGKRIDDPLVCVVR